MTQAYLETKAIHEPAIAPEFALRDLRLNKVPNIKPESLGRQSRPKDSGKSGLVFYFLASP
jgi:hypothetical protein